MSKNLRIGMMGSASLGKTTTSLLIQEDLGIELHKELESRLIKKLIRKGYIENKSSFTPDQSKWYQNHALKIRERLARRDSFISDRTAGELWVYYEMYCGKFSTKEELNLFKQRSLNIMKRYTHLFLFPFGQIPIVDNNYRNTNGQYQKFVYEKIEDMVKDFDLPYIKLAEEPLTKEERREEVLSWIRR